MIVRARSLLLLARAGRAAWWCGLPFLLLAHLVLGSESYQFEPLYDIANRIWRTSPLAAELIAEYPLWMISMLLLTIVILWSHHRRTAFVRVESLALPAYLAGFEACDRMAVFLSCRGGYAPTRAELRKELLVAATASVITMAAPLLLGALFEAKRPGTLSGSFSRRSVLPVLAAIASIAIHWTVYDLIVRGLVVS